MTPKTGQVWYDPRGNVLFVVADAYVLLSGLVAIQVHADDFRELCTSCHRKCDVASALWPRHAVLVGEL